MENVKDSEGRAKGNAIKSSGCKANNGLPCFWLPSAPSESSGSISPV